MPPLPTEQFSTSPTTVELKDYCYQAMSCSPGALRRVSTGKDAPTGELCRMSPSILGHQGTANAVERQGQSFVTEMKCSH